VLRVASQLVYGTEPVWITVLEQEDRELRWSNGILRRAVSFFGAELDRQHKK
jgi:hypothetical protein